MKIKKNKCLELGDLQLSPIKLNEEYSKEWNVNNSDYYCLSKNGELLRPTLYRVGGLNNPNLEKNNYFMLLKYVESYYSDEIMRMSGGKNPKYLSGRWVILDSYGNEKIEFNEFETPYLIEGSCLYSLNSTYYNIESGECYGYSKDLFKSTDFIFINNSYSRDPSKQGIMKINKKDGSYELFK